MARQEHVLTVFVASPGDVSDERTKLVEIIDDLNTAWSRELKTRLELIRWETDAYPSLGDDAQAVINRQIPTDYDIFIGIMWCRFGTPTKRAESGTEEEFANAKRRHDNGDSVGIMFYFKDAAVSPLGLDVDQLKQVQAFRKRLGAEGALHWPFKNIHDFEKQIRLHLTRRVQEWLRQQKDSLPLVQMASATADQTEIAKLGDDNDELGMFELLEILEDETAQTTEVLMRIASATTQVGERVAVQSKEMEDLAKRENLSTLRAAMKHVIGKVAREMNQYAERLKVELPSFRSHHEASMDAFLKSASIAIPMSSKEQRNEEGMKALSSLESMIEACEFSYGKLRGFSETVAAMPRMTTELNRARRNVTSALELLLDELTRAQGLSTEVSTSIKELISD